MKLLLHNGKLISESTFNGLNRGMYYGDGFFETIRFINGNVHLIDIHQKRMDIAFDELGLNRTASLSRLELTKSFRKLAAANELDNGKIRLTIFRKWGGTFIPESDDCEWIAELSPIKNIDFQLNRKGLLIDIYKKEKKWSESAKSFKSLNASFYVNAGRFAREKRVDEAFVLNEKNEIIESLYSNIFYQKKDQLYTPPIEGGGLPGIMRAYVIHVLQKQGVVVFEKPLLEDELHEVDELFLTNSIRGIQWVGGYKAKRFYSRHIREYSNYLNRTLSKALAIK
ncbi:MAG: branched-subunit amino acid aminotransferase/4-amino-4-deoxychorismate lyase [Salibacteraceae bacterium]